MSEVIGTYKSPDEAHSFDFIFAGEIRFGPEYYKLKLDGVLVPNRIFGIEFKWHPGSEYLALQEWLTTNATEGPITTLTLVDLKQRKFARVARADKGFVKPLKFEDDSILFEKDYSGKKTSHEMSLLGIEDWEEV